MGKDSGAGNPPAKEIIPGSSVSLKGITDIRAPHIFHSFGIVAFHLQHIIQLLFSFFRKEQLDLIVTTKNPSPFRDGIPAVPLFLPAQSPPSTPREGRPRLKPRGVLGSMKSAS